MNCEKRLSTAKPTAEVYVIETTDASDAAGAATLQVRTEIRSSVSGVRMQHPYLSAVSDGCWGEGILHSFHGTGGMGSGAGGRGGTRK